jgi:hypothetical protein
MSTRFLLGPTRGYITRITGRLESELMESVEMAAEDDGDDMMCHVVICEK